MSWFYKVHLHLLYAPPAQVLKINFNTDNVPIILLPKDNFYLLPWKIPNTSRLSIYASTYYYKGKSVLYH